MCEYVGVCVWEAERARGGSVWECVGVGGWAGGSKTGDGGRKAGLALDLKCRMELDVAMSGRRIKG